MKTRMYMCNFRNCYKSFRNEESLADHQKCHETVSQIHSSEFICSKCNRVMATKQSLKEHEFTHTGKKPFRCSEVGCGKTFRQSSQLCNHKKVHKEARKLMKKKEISVPINEIIQKNTCVALKSDSEGFYLNSQQKIVLPPLKFAWR